MRKLIALLLSQALVLAPMSGWAMSPELKTILFRQKTIVKRDFAKFSFAASPQSFTFAKSANAGDQIVVGIVSYSATSTISSVTCTGEANLTAIGSLLRPGAGVLSDGAIQMYYLPAVTVPGAKSCTVTLSAGTNLEAAGLLLHGGDPNAFLDSSNSAASNTATVTANYPRDAVIFLALSGGSNIGNQYPYTYNAMARNLQLDAMYDWLNAGPAGTKTATFNGTGNQLIYAATFKVAP